MTRNEESLRILYSDTITSSRRPIKSGYDILNVGDKTPAGNLVFYLVNDGKRTPIMTEEYAITEGGYDKDYLLKYSKNGEFVRFDGFDRIINRLVNSCGLGEEYIDQIEYSIKGNKVEFTVYPTERGIHLLNNGWWDDYSVRWSLSAEEQIPLYYGDEKVAMSVELFILGLGESIQSARRPIKSSNNDLFNQIKDYLESETAGKGVIRTRGNNLYFRTLIITVYKDGYIMRDDTHDKYFDGDTFEEFKDDYWKWVNPF